MMEHITLEGTVKKLIDRPLLAEVQQAQIYLAGADHLYDEVRVPNIYKWEVGKRIEVTMRPV